MPEAVGELAECAQKCVVLGADASDWENIPKRVHRAAEQHLEHHAESERRDRVADEYERGGYGVELSAVAQGLCDAERYAHDVAQHKAGDAEPKRYRNAGRYELPGCFVSELVRPHRKAQIVVEEPFFVALQQRLVETVIFDQFLSCLLCDVGRPRSRHGRRAAFRAHNAAHLHEPLLDWSARNKLSQGEAEYRDPQESGDHQQYSLNQIGKHRMAARGWRGLLAG